MGGKLLKSKFVLRYAINLRRQWHPTPVLLPGKSHERRSLVGATGSIRVGRDWSDLAAGDASGKESACWSRRQKRLRFNPWVGKTLWRRKWQPTAVVLPGKFHGQRSLVGYSLWGHKEPDTTEPTRTHRNLDLFLCVCLERYFLIFKGW